MRNDLLQDLCYALGDIPENIQFDMDKWYAIKCGTVCCAAGLAIVTIPSWKEAGFSLQTNCNHTPRYKDSWGYAALAEGLDIDEYIAVYIFSPLQYDDGEDIRPEHVRDRIETIL